jgi:O-antigen/teichoic acid export membrane protein
MDIARSATRIFGSNVTKKALGFLALAYFARELTPTQLGIFFLFQTLMKVVAIPTDFGIRSALKKRISEGSNRNEILTTGVLLKIALLAVFALVATVFRGPINQYLGADLAMWFIVVVVVSEFGRLVISVLMGELRVGDTASIQVAQQATWVVVGAALVSMGYGVYGLVYGLIASFVTMFLSGAYRVSLSFGTPSLDHARSLFDFSRYSFVSRVGGYVYNWMDVALIGLLLSQAAVAPYEIAWRVSSTVLLLSSALTTTIYPQMSEWHSEGRTERIEALIPKVLTPALFFVIPSFFGIVVFSRDILGIVFSQQYASAWLVLVILASEEIFQAFHMIIGRALLAIDHPELAARASVVATVINLILNVVLISYFGIIGAAVATVAASLLNDALHAVYLSRFLSLRFPFREVGWCVFASFCMVAILLWGRTVITVDTLPELVVMVVIGAVAYIGIALLFRPIRTTVSTQLSRVVGQ